MDKNDLQIRARYAAKLLNKVNTLSESINLLTRVDKQLLKQNIQSGGARLQNLSRYQRGGAGTIDLKEIQKQALISRLRLQQQKEALGVARKTINELNTNLAGVREAISGLTELMEGLNFDIEPLAKADIPDLSHFQKTLLYNAFYNIPWNELKSLPSDVTSNRNLEVKQTGGSFSKLLDILPSSNLPPISKEIKDSTNEAEYEKLRKDIHSGNVLPTESLLLKDKTRPLAIEDSPTSSEPVSKTLALKDKTRPLAIEDSPTSSEPVSKPGSKLASMLASNSKLSFPSRSSRSQGKSSPTNTPGSKSLPLALTDTPAGPSTVPAVPAPEAPLPTTKLPELNREQCIEKLKEYNINNRKDFLRWSLKNHPDKGGNEESWKQVRGCMGKLELLNMSGGRYDPVWGPI